MSRIARFAAALTATLTLALAGCDSKPSTPATDPESIKKLEELQRQNSQGETPKK
jgi:starvation-inducible outer membrane lipoprotein